jgi:ATP-binding cassette subfamily B protein
VTLVAVVVAAATGQATAGDVFLVAIVAAQANAVVLEGAELVGRVTTVRHAVGLRAWLLGGEGGTGDGCPAGRPVPARLYAGVTFDGVTFTYPGTERPALVDLDVTLPAGALVAVVGENGAGKTTLAKLLSGLHQPDAGRITVDGVDLCEFEPAAWWAAMTAGFHDFVRFQFRLSEVVGVGDLERMDDDRAIAAALDAVDARAFVDALPEGAATQLGPVFGGVDLSGGQWQKLAVARALLRPAPRLLLLDEPAASLDPAAEAAVIERYAEASRQARARTGAVTLFTTHRFVSVRHADLILVLQNGSLVEHGSHDELINRRGVYADLYAAQAHAYR